MALISVIVPVYKVELYIHRCVDSILTQTFTDFELVLVDDGSPDNCGVICDEYALKDNRTIVIHKENGGHSDARNAGIDWTFANSDSKWITFVDSDDWIHPKYLEILYSLCIDNHVMISSCGHESTDGVIKAEQAPESYQIRIADALNIVNSGYTFSQFNISVIWGRLYNKELFRCVRFPLNRNFEDEYVTYKLLFDCGSIAITTEPLYYYFQNPMGVMASELTPKRLNDRLDAFYEQLCYYREHDLTIMYENRFKSYCGFINRYSSEYKDRLEYEQIINTHRSIIKACIKNDYALMPELLKRYGYKKWISGRAAEIEDIKKSSNDIKSEKGLFFSLLWRIKAYLLTLIGRK